MSETALETRELTRDFSGVTAVDALSTAFERGEISAVIGPNGAGKTTFFDLVSGRLTPTSGEIHFDGGEITDLPADEVARRGLVRSFQIANLFGDLTARENVRVAVQSRSEVNSYNFWTDSDRYADVTERTEHVLDTVGLDHRGDINASDLSYGQQRMLEIALVLAMDPALILLDEPTSGLSAESTEEIVGVIEEISTDRTTIVIEHDMGVVERIANHVKVFHGGKVFAEGTPGEIRGDSEVQEVYLGE